jgi:hypothetical protein
MFGGFRMFRGSVGIGNILLYTLATMHENSADALATHVRGNAQYASIQVLPTSPFRSN